MRESLANTGYFSPATVSNAGVFNQASGKIAKDSLGILHPEESGFRMTGRTKCKNE